MAKYRKKPVVIEAIQLTRKNWNRVCDFIDLPWGPDGVHGVFCDKGVMSDDGDMISLVIPTLEGNHRADRGDYIIRGINGEYYPCKPDIFEKTYEPVKTATIPYYHGLPLDQGKTNADAIPD